MSTVRIFINACVDDLVTISIRIKANPVLKI